MSTRIEWPDGTDFAFTVFDDTDYATLENVEEVYSFLADVGFRTTKSAWPIRGDQTPQIGGATCEDKGYLDWILQLQEQGFEIGLHNVTYHTSKREETIRGIERFRKLFGHYPYTLANHAGCLESIYWGNYRLTGVHETIYNLLHLNRRKGVFQGHVEGSPLFWGDVCKEKIKYVRNFVFAEINSLKACPHMPYHDPKREKVNYFFASSEGANVESFVSTLSEKNQDRLMAEGGACIMYTHFANGFFENGRLHPRFRTLMERLGKMNGWLVPVHRLLDHLLEARGPYELTDRERRRLERKWLFDKIVRVHGTS